MAIETWAIDDHAAWLNRRKADVTASAIAALLGCHQHMTAYKLWAVKSGLIEDESDEAEVGEDSIVLPPTERGLLMEAPATELLRRIKPGWTIERCGTYYRDAEARVGATPDLLVRDEAGRRGVVQLKNPAALVYREKWIQEDGSIQPPLDYAVQTTIERHLTGADFAAVGALVNGYRTEFRLIEIPETPDLVERLYSEVAAFWRMVDDRTPPPPDFARDGNIIAALYPDDDGSTVDLSRNNRIAGLVDHRDALKAREADGSAAEKKRKAIDTELIHALGPATRGLLAGGRVIEAKTVRRSGYYVEPSSYRSIKIKERKAS